MFLLVLYGVNMGYLRGFAYIALILLISGVVFIYIPLEFLGIIRTRNIKGVHHEQCTSSKELGRWYKG